MRKRSSLPGLAAVSATALLCACEVREPANQTAALPPAVMEEPRALPLPDTALDRAALLGAIAEAASAHATGTDDAAIQRALDGRRFAMRLRFGCGGPTESADAALRWRVKTDTSLEISATPDLSLDSPALAGIPRETVEAVEGFWLARPWQLSDACPASDRTLLMLDAAPERSVGIAQYHGPEESRVDRRSGRAYVSDVAIEPGAPLPRDGFILQLEGRLRAWPNGKPIRCTITATAARPGCIVSIRLDRAAFVAPADGAVIDEWTR